MTPNRARAEPVRVTASLQISVAWWVRPYLGSVALFAAITGMEPDMAKVRAMVQRGLRTRIRTASQDQE